MTFYFISSVVYNNPLKAGILKGIFSSSELHDIFSSYSKSILIKCTERVFTYFTCVFFYFSLWGGSSPAGEHVMWYNPLSSNFLLIFFLDNSNSDIAYVWISFNVWLNLCYNVWTFLISSCAYILCEEKYDLSKTFSKCFNSTAYIKYSAKVWK